MSSIEALQLRITELERENAKLTEKFRNERIAHKKQAKIHKKHIKDHTCIYRIKSNNQMNYFEKSLVNRRRCKKKINELLRSVDNHINKIGKYILFCFFSVLMFNLN
jgi:hypothetical protein